jgi:PqqD family protein of HPr-rel-A system
MVSDADALCWEHWNEEESVLFDRRSGQTHLLTPMATECLLLLQSAALDPDQLVEKLGARLVSGPEQATREQIAQLLRALNELGLIREVSV